MDAGKLALVREALDVYDVDRREALLDDRESEVTRFLIRLGAYDSPYVHHDGPEEEYRDWNGALVGSGPSTRVRDRIPADPTLAGEMLAPLAEWGNYARQLAARHFATPAAVLKRIVSGADAQMLHDIALHPNADADLFALLAHSERVDARWSAASAPRCPLAILELLACDCDPRVRLQALSNRSLPPRMQWLTDDLEVRRTLANHPLSPPQMLAVLAGDADALVRTCVAGNHATPASVLADLATDPVVDVRSRIAFNPNTTAEIWNALAHDDNPSVREALRSSTCTPAELKARLARESRRR